MTNKVSHDEQERAKHSFSSPPSIPLEPNDDGDEWLAQESKSCRVLHQNSVGKEEEEEEEKMVKDREQLSCGASLSPTMTTEEERVIEILSPEVLKEKIETTQSIKELGNSFFRQGLFEGAITEYSKAIDLLPDSLSKEKSILLSNRAAALLNLVRISPHSTFHPILIELSY